VCERGARIDLKSPHQKVLQSKGQQFLIESLAAFTWPGDCLCIRHFAGKWRRSGGVT
jgi:hypothetical protein